MIYRDFHCRYDIARKKGNSKKRKRRKRKRGRGTLHEIAIGIIGRLVPVKNHHMFLRVLKRIKKAHRYKIRAFIIGDGEMKEELKRTC